MWACAVHIGSLPLWIVKFCLQLKMASEKNLITISSTNCRGLGEYTKRKDVFNYLRNKGHNIYCLQDTHFTKSMEPYIKAEWGGEIIFNSYN